MEPVFTKRCSTKFASSVVFSVPMAWSQTFLIVSLLETLLYYQTRTDGCCCCQERPDSEISACLDCWTWGLLVARLLSDLGLGNHVPVALRRWVLGRASERTVNAGLSSIPGSQLMRRLLKVCLSPPPQRILRIVRSVGLQGRGKERYLRFCMSQNQNIYWVLLTQDCQNPFCSRLPGG